MLIDLINPTHRAYTCKIYYQLPFIVTAALTLLQLVTGTVWRRLNVSLPFTIV